MVIDGFVPSGNLTYSHGKSPWKWAMASMGGWVYWTIGMCHDAFLDVALTMVGMRCAMNIINYVYSYEFQLFLLISLLSLHVTMQMSLLLLCPCSHMFSLIFSLTIVVYRCWLSLLSNLGDSLACHLIRVVRRGASSKAAEEKETEPGANRRRNHMDGGSL
jgi:hypothetical protein